ncbi:MAG TPA: TetR/AcrR family transcriptional regulator [Candidatus Nesterenkonia stercoripullorum]|uniref:TetR/AcrR family transcriptional regulator n=1 Tax=Candidatus Nesterenkonia stercoripullorum TaxID=2838701 RepID=A0A9D1RZ01_9MICC|nr:TetR/AcrR family transcriptional regulator [Candidatus Nesterenkonia stercoripullorum]
MTAQDDAGRAPARPDRENDPRFVRSRQALIAAITEILESGTSPDDVRVSDIARRAGVSRPTFYQHFATVSELTRTTALQRLTDVFAQVPEAVRGENWSIFIGKTLSLLLGSLRAQRTFFLTVLQGSTGAHLREDITKFISTRLLENSPLAAVISRREGPDSPQERAEFLAAGVMWLCVRWLRESDPDPVDSMVERISALLLAASGASQAEQDAVREGLAPEQS